MRVGLRAFAVTVCGGLVLAAGGPGGGTAGATRPAKDVAEARLLNVDYQDGLLTPKDARAFLRTTTATPKVAIVGAGEWRAPFCNKSLPEAEHVVVGRNVRYDPSNSVSMGNYVVAFDSAKQAARFMTSAQRAAKSCFAPYMVGTARFAPGTAPKVPKLGSKRAVLGGTYTFDNGQTADSVALALQDGQVVEFVQMLSTDEIPPKTVASVAKSMDRRLRETVEATKSSKPRPKRKSAVSSCEELLTKGSLERAFAVSLQEPDDCSYALAQGFGGVDVGFATVASGADRTWAALAKGEPVAVRGAADALYSRSTNQFGQASETVYVRLRNGDYFRIGLRGDDAPKDQKVQLIQAAKAAIENT